MRVASRRGNHKLVLLFLTILLMSSLFPFGIIEIKASSENVILSDGGSVYYIHGSNYDVKIAKTTGRISAMNISSHVIPTFYEQSYVQVRLNETVDTHNQQQASFTVNVDVNSTSYVQLTFDGVLDDTKKRKINCVIRFSFYPTYFWKNVTLLYNETPIYNPISCEWEYMWNMSSYFDQLSFINRTSVDYETYSLATLKALGGFMPWEVDWRGYLRFENSTTGETLDILFLPHDPLNTHRFSYTSANDVINIYNYYRGIHPNGVSIFRDSAVSWKIGFYFNKPEYEVLQYGFVERWRNGNLAAFTFLDDDLHGLEEEKAILYGSSDPNHPYYGVKGLLAHGIYPTLGMWMFNASSWSLGLYTDVTMTAYNQEVKSFVDDLLTRGIDFELHTPSDQNDNNTIWISAVSKFKSYFGSPIMYIQHSTNLENYNHQGGGNRTIEDVSSQVDGTNVFSVSHTVIMPASATIDGVGTYITDFNTTHITLAETPSVGQVVKIEYYYETEYTIANRLTNITYFGASYTYADTLNIFRNTPTYGYINPVIHVAHYAASNKYFGKELYYLTRNAPSTKTHCNASWVYSLINSELTDFLKEQGGFIGYIHFESSTSEYWSQDGSTYVVSDTAESIFATIDNKMIWTPTAIQLYDALRQRALIRFSATKTGNIITYTIRNLDASDANGLQIRVLTDQPIAYVEGAKWWCDIYENQYHLVVDVPAGSSVTVTVHLGTLSEGIYIKNSDMAVVSSVNYHPTDRKLTIVLDGEKTSVTKVYCGSLGKPALVEGADSWSYDAATKTLTLTVTHHSPATVIVTWPATTVTPMVKVMLGLVPFLAALLLFWPYLQGKRKADINELIPAVIALVILLCMVAWVWTLW